MTSSIGVSQGFDTRFSLSCLMKVIPLNGPSFMHQEPVPADPGPDGGLPADHPELGSPHWRLVPQSPDWPEWMDDAHAADEDPGDLEEYEDPDNAPPRGLDDAELEALIPERRQGTRHA